MGGCGDIIAGSASGTTASPSTASLALTGATSTVTTNNNKLASPSTGSLILTGATPSLTIQNYTWYTLPAPGGYDSNSILGSQTYPAGSWLRVVTDFAHITADYATGPLQNDINDYAVAEGGYTGSDSATYEIKTPALATSQYTVTATIDGDISLGPTVASLALTGATPVITASNHKTSSPTTASLALTGATPTFAATQNKVMSPTTATLALTGETPILFINGVPIGGNKTSITRALTRSLTSQLSR